MFHKGRCIILGVKSLRKQREWNPGPKRRFSGLEDEWDGPLKDRGKHFIRKIKQAFLPELIFHLKCVVFEHE